jgi:hypothetical protein
MRIECENASYISDFIRYSEYGIKIPYILRSETGFRGFRIVAGGPEQASGQSARARSAQTFIAVAIHSASPGRTASWTALSSAFST